MVGDRKSNSGIRSAHGRSISCLSGRFARTGVLVLVLSATACGGRTYLDFSGAQYDEQSPASDHRARISLAPGAAAYFYVANSRVKAVTQHVLFIPYRDNRFQSQFLSPYYQTRIVGEVLSPPSYFVIEVLVDSDTNQIEIASSGICVRTADKVGQVCPDAWISPSVPYLGRSSVLAMAPEKRWSFWSYHAPMCDNAYTRADVKMVDGLLVAPYKPFVKLDGPESINVRAGEAQCIVLRYPISPPSPEIPFTLRFWKVLVNGNNASIPALSFVHGSSANPHH